MRIASLAIVAAFAACHEPVVTLDVDAGSEHLQGTFVHEGVSIEFTAASAGGRVTVALDIGGTALDVELDAGVLVEDGHGASLYERDVAALLALRDAFAEQPALVETPHGAQLLRTVDRFAEVPIGLVLDRHVVDLSVRARTFPGPGCRDDGVTCLSGTHGTTWAVFDNGSTGTCLWRESAYGDSACRGRCGAGCNWFDEDYTWDCLDHDVCLDQFGGSSTSGNVDCGDEFWDAADDYAATIAPLCWSGTNRTPPSFCGDGVVGGGEECDDGNTSDGDGCSATCAREPTSITVGFGGAIVIDRKQRVELPALATYGDGTTREVGAVAAWTSSAPAVAAVAARTVEGKQAGTATVTVAYGGRSATVEVRVADRECGVTINELRASGATAADEWVELYNACTASVDVTGWTLVYRSASAIGSTDSAVLATLSGMLAPGAHRVYASASAPAAITGIADGTWTTGGTSGMLQRTSGAIGLRAGAGSSARLVDAVGYGAVAAGHPFAEGGAATVAADPGFTLARGPFDGRDGDANAQDLARTPPTPKARNSR